MKKLLVLIALFSFAGFLSGQNTIQSYVSSSEVGLGEIFNFEIIVDSKDCPVNSPDFGELTVVAGPFSQQSSSTVIVNGSRQQMIEIKWTYQLRGPKIGTYTIPGVTMNCDGKIISSLPLEIEVKEGIVAPVDKNYFMELTSNKSVVYEGEPFVVSLKYYARNRPESLDGVDLGNAVGIYREDLNPDRQTFQTGREQINGVLYYTIELLEEVCYAQRSGTVRLEPYYAVLGFQNGNIFNRFSKETYSNSLEIEVKELPLGTTSDFNGLVGDFTVSGTISKEVADITDAVDIKITISGTGNFDALGELDLKIPAEFNIFSPKIEENTKISRNGMTGEVTYNYVIIPNRPGKYEIPACSFSYFNLAKKKMERISTSSFKLKVENKNGIEITSDKVDSEIAVNDIRYIEESDPSFFKDEDLLFGSWKFGTLLVSPILLSFFLILIKRRKENISEDDRIKIQQKNEIRQAQLAFKHVRAFADAGENAKALKGLQTILNTFFRNKFNVGLSELSKRSIEQRLAQLNVADGIQQQFSSIWDTIEMGQYAPIAHENLVQTVNKTEELIITLDKTI